VPGLYRATMNTAAIGKRPAALRPWISQAIGSCT